MLKAFSPEGNQATPPERPKEKFGQNVALEIEFCRHEEPGKTPEGMSADFLTEKGKERAAAKGKLFKQPKVKGYASPKLRAQETVDLALRNVNANVEIINQKLSSPADQGKKTIGQITRGQKPENTFNIRLRPELDTTKNFAKIMPEAKQWAKEQIATGAKGKEHDYIIQYYLDHTERARELGVTPPEQTAEEIAFAASREIGMTKRLYSDSRAHLLNGTHGPKLEPFLQRVIIGPNGKKGFESLDEIGGAFNPGESFKFISQTDEAGKQTVKLLFRGQEYEVDLEKLEELSDGYILSQQDAGFTNLPPALRAESLKERHDTPKIIKALKAFQPTGDLIKDLDALYKIRSVSLARVFTDWITSKTLVDYDDPEALYAYFISAESQAKINGEHSNELERTQVKTLKRILEAYEAKRVKKER